MCPVQLDRSAVIAEGLVGKEMDHMAANDEAKNAWKYCSVKYKRNFVMFVRFGTECVIETTYVLCYINHFSPAVSFSFV